MNLTLRVRTNRRSVVIKQARPWVEKYDHIEAPWNRIDFECRFYERVAEVEEVLTRMPTLLASDHDAHTIMLEYIDGADDLASLYAGGNLDRSVLTELADYLVALHSSTRSEPSQAFSNRGMRELNHAHIFVVPLQGENGVPLEQFETGFEATAIKLRGDAGYRKVVEKLGEQYLEPGSCLVHGDYFPGSWLWCPRGLFVIDPEFCFVGTPEIDLGCAIAHLALAKQNREVAQSLLSHCTQGSADLDFELLGRYAAVEVMRRLIGVAQLPIPASSGWRSELLLRSRRAMLDSSWELLWT